MHQTTRHPDDKRLTLDEVAALARVDVQTVTDAVRDRRLKAVQERGQWLVAVAEMRRWLSRR